MSLASTAQILRFGDLNRVVSRRFLFLGKVRFSSLARREDSQDDELLNVHKRGNFHQKHPDGMTDKEKDKTLESLVFLKGKRDNTVKDRKCADGKK